MFGNNRNGGGVLTGLILAIIIIAIALFGWLYGGKIIGDIKEKLNTPTEIVQPVDASNNEIFITLK